MISSVYNKNSTKENCAERYAAYQTSEKKQRSILRRMAKQTDTWRAALPYRILTLAGILPAAVLTYKSLPVSPVTAAGIGLLFLMFNLYRFFTEYGMAEARASIRCRENEVALLDMSNGDFASLYFDESGSERVRQLVTVRARDVTRTVIAGNRVSFYGSYRADELKAGDGRTDAEVLASALSGTETANCSGAVHMFGWFTRSDTLARACLEYIDKEEQNATTKANPDSGAAADSGDCGHDAVRVPK